MTLTDRPPSVMARKRPAPKRGHVRRDPNSMVASAALMTGAGKSKARISTAAWQSLAWDFYDEIGELRFSVNWLANALSRVNLVAAIPPAQQGDEPTPIDLETMKAPGLQRAVELVEQIAGGIAGQGQLLAGCAKQLTVPGVGYVLATADDITDSFSSWRTLSNEEAREQNGAIQVTDATSGDWIDVADTDLLIKLWRAHPRRAHDPDSPVRAVLGPLSEIKLLTQRIAADARSRLAGNGLLVIPDEAEFPPGQGNADGSGEEVDEFVETLIQVTQIPISDQSSPAATTPLVIRVPGEYVDKIQHITFYSDFDASLDTLRQAAVKRLALGMDMPPEVLLGMGDSNHWSAWQIAEEAITLQIEPLAETIVHALTVGFLRSALVAEGLDPDLAIVWYDTTDLSTRPDRSAAAGEAHARIQISNAAYLSYLGLDDGDAPDDKEFERRLLVQLALANPQLAPMFLQAAGIVLDLTIAPVEAAVGAAPLAAPTPPKVEQAAPAPPGPPAQPADTTVPPGDDAQSTADALAAAALLAGADGLVIRALERAGARLRSAAGKGKGGSAAIPCPDPTVLHCAIPATEFASVDALLADAWDRAPLIAARCGVDPESLTACLDGYARALIAAGHAHDYDRLAAALGVRSADRRLVAAH